MSVVQRILLVLAGFVAASAAYGSQPEQLSEKEEARLIEFAIDEAGVSVWQVMSAVTTVPYPPFATTTVVFEPTETADTCLARAVHLSTDADADGNFNWSSAPRKEISYMLWFTRCEAADVYEAIRLRELIGFDVLEQIRDESASILDQMYSLLDKDRDDSRPDPRLSEILQRYDPNHGPVYTVTFDESLDCIFVAGDVLLEANGARVLEARWGNC